MTLYCFRDPGSIAKYCHNLVDDCGVHISRSATNHSPGLQHSGWHHDDCSCYWSCCQYCVSTVNILREQKSNCHGHEMSYYEVEFYCCTLITLFRNPITHTHTHHITSHSMDENAGMTIGCGISHKNIKYVWKYSSKYYKYFTQNKGFT
jgi:hypothetical protein